MAARRGRWLNGRDVLRRYTRSRHACHGKTGTALPRSSPDTHNDAYSDARGFAVPFDGSEETWKMLAHDRELARDALRVLESMTPCGNDADGVEKARGYLREAIDGLNRSLGRAP